MIILGIVAYIVFIAVLCQILKAGTQQLERDYPLTERPSTLEEWKH